MSFERAMAEHYPHALPLEVFVQLSRSALLPYGFAPDNSLPLVGACRDELMFDVTERLHDEWGPPFALSSLAGLVLLGRSGLQAAAHHAPDDEGRRRFVVFSLVHIGISADGSVGLVHRDGQPAASTACGALVQLHRELVSGELDLTIDRNDLEISMVRLELLRNIRYGRVPDLVEFTEVARRSAAAEIERLTSELVRDPDCDVALLTGTVVHGPNGDWVDPVESWVSLAGGAPAPFTLD